MPEQPADLVVDLPPWPRQRALLRLDLPHVLLDDRAAENVEVAARIFGSKGLRQPMRCARPCADGGHQGGEKKMLLAARSHERVELRLGEELPVGRPPVDSAAAERVVRHREASVNRRRPRR